MGVKRLEAGPGRPEPGEDSSRLNVLSGGPFSQELMAFMKARLAEGEPPSIALVQIQPEPTLCRVTHLWNAAGCTTSIMRHWKPGDSGPGGHCRLCPECDAYCDGCLISVEGFVTREEARMLSTVGFRETRSPGGLGLVAGDGP